jgi:Ca-activated chloride channel homolog
MLSAQHWGCRVGPLTLLLLVAAGVWADGPAKVVRKPRIDIEPRAKPGNAEQGSTPRSNIRIDSNLALINVTVTDALNRLITGLGKDNFRIFEDNVEQQITQFATEDTPVSVGLIFDTSDSMRSKLGRSRRALVQFLKTANRDDEFFLVEFSDRPELATGFTPSPDEIESKLSFIPAKGRTALLDGVVLALNNMANAQKPRKALVIISDGGDNNSRYSAGEIRRRVSEADVQVYALGILTPVAPRIRPPDERLGAQLLSDLAEESGGYYIPVENPKELPEAATKLGTRLRSQYILGYSPMNQERDGKYRHVRVKLVQPPELPPLHAYWRMGYYAPIQ